MKRTFILVSIICALLLVGLAAPQAQAVVIYNNFGAGDTYDTLVGWTISSAGSSVTIDNDQGDAFVPTDTYTLDTIELAIWLVSGTNELDVWLMDDNSGEPGSVIETFNFVDQMVASPGSILVGTSVLNPVLNAGSQYWLVASTPGTDSWAAWNQSLAGEGLHAERQDLGAWTVVYSEDSGAFRITGTPVPEPATMLLVGFGFIGIGVARRRLK